MSPSHDLPAVEVLTVGAVGPPGGRVFYLQARSPIEQVTLKVEKQQVVALCQAVTELLADLPQPGPLPTGLDLLEPVEPEWIVGVLALGPWDEETDRVSLVVQEAVPEEEGPGEVARFGVSREQLAALARRGVELAAAGRPPCPLCHRPLDQTGHTCPRSNGHLAR